jgi:hypothetical protein
MHYLFGLREGEGGPWPWAWRGCIIRIRIPSFLMSGPAPDPRAGGEGAVAELGRDCSLLYQENLFKL